MPDRVLGLGVGVDLIPGRGYETHVQRQSQSELPKEPSVADMEYTDITAVISIVLKSPSPFYYP